MDTAQHKKDSAYHMMKYLMGILLLTFGIFILAFFLFSCNSDDQTARLQHRENVIVTIGNITDIGVIAIQ